ncbi:MAG: hypothetical protein LUD27_09125 [Clostridia bacterium]|nr:hypothetical protein [Clostridia bacterium]
MTENYMSFDSLSIAVKAGAAEDMKTWYGAFGWNVEKEYGDKIYGDIVHMDFTRPHKIEHKDRLQLLQVRFEMLINLIARAGRRGNVKTGVTAAALFLLGAAIVVCGALLAIWSDNAFYLACGIIVIVAGILFWIVSYILCLHMRRNEKQKYSVLANVLKENIKNVVKEAASLTGFTYGIAEQSKA